MAERHAPNRPVATSAAGLALALAAALLVPLAGGCGGNASGGAPARTRVSFHHYFSGTLSGGIDSMVKVFNDSQREWELVATPIDHESFKTNIVASLKSGRAPDLYSYWAGSRTRAIVDRLRPIDELWNKEGFDSLFPRILAESAAAYRGKKYLLPITQHYVAFFYNKEVFRKAGVEEPRDWPAFLAACAKLKASGVVPIALGAKDRWPAQFWYDYLLLRTAGSSWRAHLVAGTARFSDPESRRAFRMWKELLDAGYFNADAATSDWALGAAMDVKDGRAAMTLMGTWIMGAWDDPGGTWRPGIEYDAFAFPIVDPAVPLAALGPVDGIVVPLKDGDPAPAMAALAFFASVPSQAAMSSGSGAFAPRIGVPDRIYNAVQRKLLGIISVAASWDYNFDLIFPQEVAEAGLDAFLEFLAFPSAWERIVDDLAASAAAAERR